MGTSIPAAAIQKGLAEGTIKPYPLELIGGYLYQDIVAVMNLIREQTDPAKQEKTIQDEFAIFWDGIKANELLESGQVTGNVVLLPGLDVRSQDYSQTSAQRAAENTSVESAH